MTTLPPEMRNATNAQKTAWLKEHRPLDNQFINVSWETLNNPVTQRRIPQGERRCPPTSNGLQSFLQGEGPFGFIGEHLGFIRDLVTPGR